MSFKVIEKYIIGKDNTLISCEDRIVTTNDFICLIDGATSKSEILLDNKKQGIIAGDLIEDVIRTSKYSISLDEFIDNINQNITSFYKSRNLLENMKNNPIDRVNASIIVFSNHLKEIWLIGDCQANINGNRITNSKHIDDVLAEIRSLVIELELLKGKSLDSLKEEGYGRNFIMPFLKEQHKFQNNKLSASFSYGVIDGFKINMKDVKIIKVKNNDNVVFATDGYPKLFQSLIESENYLEKILLADPLFYLLHKSTKGVQKGQVTFDDRAYVKFKIE